MTARMATPVTEVGDYEIQESSHGVTLKMGDRGQFLAFETALDARMLVAMVLQIADLLDDREAERATRPATALEAVSAS